MEDGDALAESSGEIFDHGWGQVDFGNQHQNVLSFRKDLLAKAEVDLGLAASGHALKKNDPPLFFEDLLVGFPLLKAHLMGYFFF